MEFNEALSNIGTNSSNVKGVPKRVGGIVRRPIPAGYTADIRGSDEEDDDDTWKEFYKKQKRQDEGRTITRDTRPSYDHSDMRDFWDVDEKDEEELKELFVQLSGTFNDIAMSPHWEKGRQYDDEEYEEDEEEDDENESRIWTSPTLGYTSSTDPNYTEAAMSPFWRKGKKYKTPDNEEEFDIEYDDEAEDEEDE